MTTAPGAVAYLVINEIVYFLERPAVELGRERLELGGEAGAVLDTELPPGLEAVLAHQLHSFPLEPLERLLGEGLDLGAGPGGGRRSGVRVALAEAAGLQPALGAPRVRLRTRGPRLDGRLAAHHLGVRRRRLGRVCWTRHGVARALGPEREAAWRKTRGRLPSAAGDDATAPPPTTAAASGRDPSALGAFHAEESTRTEPPDADAPPPPTKFPYLSNPRFQLLTSFQLSSISSSRRLETHYIFAETLKHEKPQMLRICIDFGRVGGSPGSRILIKGSVINIRRADDGGD